MKESDLFAPVKRLFTAMGYSVNAEVCSCDLTAVSGDELIIVELKRNLSVTLLSQALDRQKCGAKVYIAVPKPKNYSPRKFRDTLYVLKKLELGLIFVTLRDDDCRFAEIIWEPQPFVPVRQNKKIRTKILKEINGREQDNNTGGISRRKVATAFTERNIFVACIALKYGSITPKMAKELTGADCQAILGRNYYGWFDKLGKGLYAANEKCLSELDSYPELKEYYIKKTNNIRASL